MARPGGRIGIIGALALALAGTVLAGCASSDGATSEGTHETELNYVAHPPAPIPARRFSAGSYVVGQDVELGRYSSTGPCRWLQQDNSGLTLDRSGEARPTQVLTLSTRGSQLVVTGVRCTFVRLP